MDKVIKRKEEKNLFTLNFLKNSLKIGKSDHGLLKVIKSEKNTCTN